MVRTYQPNSGLGASGLWLWRENSARGDRHRSPRGQPRIGNRGSVLLRGGSRDTQSLKSWPTSGLGHRGSCRTRRRRGRPRWAGRGRARLPPPRVPPGLATPPESSKRRGGRRGAPRPDSNGPPAPQAVPDAADLRRQLRGPPHAVLLGGTAVPGARGPGQVSVE